MVLTNDIQIPTYEELTVPQEITLSTSWLKAVAPYMNLSCENEVKQRDLRNSCCCAEYEDPRKTLKEGARVTACGVDFLRKLKKVCLEEVTSYANCIDTASDRLFITKCRQTQYPLDKCVEENLKITRPPAGYFSKVHVFQSNTPPPPPFKYRDYHAEAAKIMADLPEDFHIRQDYRKFKEHNLTWFYD